MTEKTLVLIFKNANGDNVRLSIDNVRDDLTDLEAKAAMETIIAKNVFSSNGGDLVAIGGAEIVTRSTAELSVK